MCVTIQDLGEPSDVCEMCEAQPAHTRPRHAGILPTEPRPAAREAVSLFAPHDEASNNVALVTRGLQAFLNIWGVRRSAPADDTL